MPNKLIAHELSICETTVKVHLRHIFRKLGTTNRTHAALLAREMLDVPALSRAASGPQPSLLSSSSSSSSPATPDAAEHQLVSVESVGTGEVRNAGLVMAALAIDEP